MLMSILGPKKGEVTEGQISLQHEGLHDLHFRTKSVG
jgi:hypothetical protein